MTNEPDNLLTQAKAGKYLTFLLNHQVYGIPVSAVREINRMSEITPVPQTPPFISGVINLRGKVIPVVSLRLKLELEDAKFGRETCIVVVDTNTSQVGMIVDSVRSVIDITEDQIGPAPDLGEPEKMAFVFGLARVEGEIVILFNVMQAFTKENLLLSLKDLAA